MKNLLKKLSRSGGSDRLAELEQDAAEQIKSVGSSPPAEATAGTWGDPSPVPGPPEAQADVGHHDEQLDGAPPAGRRLTVQERVAARQLQH